MDIQIIQNKIYEIRSQRVMLDRDLAEMYGVETKVLNQAVKRNLKRFPDDFVFQLTFQELQNWKSQIVTSNSIKMGVRKRPYAFTEQGVAMLAGVLNSDAAVRANIVIMRAFVRMRSYLATTPETLAARLESIDRRLMELEQTRIAGELGLASEAALPERLSAEVRIVDYSVRAVVIFTENRQD
ncbi:ORF6N domain-containing protein, partial [Phocaeicola sp.]|uniref:ORF6N domain-containing protein n=1 Tax=Phocaeicola sp. TaxID=2773926 RepID=UPI00307C51EA